MYVDASRLTGPLATSASAKLASRKSGPFQVDSVTRGEDGSVTAVKLDLTLFGNKMADKHHHSTTRALPRSWATCPVTITIYMDNCW